MKIDEAIKQCNELINDFKNGVEMVNATDIQAIETVLKELEKVRYGRNFLMDI